MRLFLAVKYRICLRWGSKSNQIDWISRKFNFSSNEHDKQRHRDWIIPSSAYSREASADILVQLWTLPWRETRGWSQRKEAIREKSRDRETKKKGEKKEERVRDTDEQAQPQVEPSALSDRCVWTDSSSLPPLDYVSSSSLLTSSHVTQWSIQHWVRRHC